MMYPLLALMATQSQLVVVHARAYAAHLGEAFGLASAPRQRRTLLGAGSAINNVASCADWTRASGLFHVFFNGPTQCATLAQRVWQWPSTYNQGHSMTTFANSPQCWTTASAGCLTDPLRRDFSALHEHLANCQTTHRHLVTLRCAAQTLRGFLAARFVTTVVLAGVFLGVNIWRF